MENTEMKDLLLADILEELKRYVDIERLNRYDAKLKSWVRNLIGSEAGGAKVIAIRGKGELPSVGNPNIIYMETTHNLIYMWNDQGLKYEVFGSDWNQIELIYGGDSTELIK